MQNKNVPGYISIIWCTAFFFLFAIACTFIHLHIRTSLHIIVFFTKSAENSAG